MNGQTLAWFLIPQLVTNSYWLYNTTINNDNFLPMAIVGTAALVVLFIVTIMSSWETK